MRRAFLILAALAVTACAPAIPDSGAGVGFEDYGSYLARQKARDEALRTGQAVTVQPPVAADPRTAPVSVVYPQTPEQQTASDAVAAVRGTQDASVVQTEVVTPVRAATRPSNNNPDLSDEQDFSAVSNRQTIESDAQRRAAQSAQYQVIAPTALPNRPRSSGAPTPIEFAVSTSHPIGQKVYRRSPFGAGKSAQACARYTSSEAAQQAFLDGGGPKRDRLGLDPDGDGYACRWNPNLYRNVRSN